MRPKQFRPQRYLTTVSSFHGNLNARVMSALHVKFKFINIIVLKLENNTNAV